MSKKHCCADHYLSKEMIISKVINGSLYHFAVSGKHCDLCGEEVISSNEVKKLEKRIQDVNIKTMKKGKYDRYTFFTVSEEIQNQMPDTPKGWRSIITMNIFEYIWYKIKSFVRSNNGHV